MSKWFYYNSRGEKIEVTGGQLKGLAKAGVITPETIVETEEGKSAPARKVKGLTFAESKQAEVKLSALPPSATLPVEVESAGLASPSTPSDESNPLIKMLPKYLTSKNKYSASEIKQQTEGFNFCMSIINKQLEENVEIIKQLNQKVRRDIQKLPPVQTPQVLDPNKPVHTFNIFGGCGLLFLAMIPGVLGILMVIPPIFTYYFAEVFTTMSAISITAGIILLAISLIMGHRRTGYQLRCPSCGLYWAIEESEIKNLVSHHYTAKTSSKKQFTCKHCGYEWIYQYG